MTTPRYPTPLSPTDPPLYEVRLHQRWKDAKGTATVRAIVDDQVVVLKRKARNHFLLGIDVLEDGMYGWHPLD